MGAFLSFFFFFSCVRFKRVSWSRAFLTETVEIGDKYRYVDNIFERCRAFPERVGSRILSLESDDFFGTSEYFSVERKENLYEQNFSETSMMRLNGRVL